MCEKCDLGDDGSNSTLLGVGVDALETRSIGTGHEIVVDIGTLGLRFLDEEVNDSFETDARFSAAKIRQSRVPP